MSAAAAVSRVLVGVDLDEASTSALKLAGVLASANNAEVTVFHSSPVEVPAYFTGDQIETLEAERAAARHAAAKEVRALAAQHVGRGVRVVVAEDLPAEALLRMADDFDLIVVGTHRRHGVRRWWLGSVAEAVVRGSRRPVLVVPAGAAMVAERRPTVLAAGNDAGADAWVELLRNTFGADVVRSAGIHHCVAEHLQRTDLIVLSMPARSDADFGVIVEVLKECVHPVLFVPPSGGTVERYPS
jgi:nucleotide-binding universal stress UspA family protein